jgi:hypothetical protein
MALDRAFGWWWIESGPRDFLGEVFRGLFSSGEAL